MISLRSDRYKDALDEFWLPTGPPKLVFFYQARAAPLPRGLRTHCATRLR